MGPITYGYAGDTFAACGTVLYTTELSQDTLPSPFPIASLSKYYYSGLVTSDVYGSEPCSSASLNYPKKNRKKPPRPKLQ